MASLWFTRDRITRTETSEKGDEIEREIPFLKGYTVFNAEQIDNLPPHFTAPAAPTLDPVARIAHAESFFAATGADIRHGGNQAYYVPPAISCRCRPSRPSRTLNRITRPLVMNVATGLATKRALHREFGRKRWGDEGYAAEELVAELGSAFLCADLALTPEPPTITPAISELAQGAQERQAGDFYRRVLCRTSRRLPAWIAAQGGNGSRTRSRRRQHQGRRLGGPPLPARLLMHRARYRRQAIPRGCSWETAPPPQRHHARPLAG